jgi:hypothetical protein
MGKLEFDERVLGITQHTDVTAATDIVPFDVNAPNFMPCHVELHTMDFFEKIEEMVEVFDSNIFDSKFVHKETELDGTPFVMPEARCGSRFIVAFNNKASLKKTVGKDACLGKSISPLADFKVNPPIMVLVGKLVPLDKFFQNVCDLIHMYSGSGIGVSR